MEELRVGSNIEVWEEDQMEGSLRRGRENRGEVVVG